jgi:hypothetical protein
MIERLFLCLLLLLLCFVLFNEFYIHQMIHNSFLVSIINNNLSILIHC